MTMIPEMRPDFNHKVRFDFEGGDLSSNSGLILLAEFMDKLGVPELLRQHFKTKDTAVRVHKDHENLLQSLLQIFCGYPRDDCADHLTREPLFGAILHKDTLASQPTMSRFYNRTDEETVEQLNEIIRLLREKVYRIRRPTFILFDLDSTLLPTYGHQEGAGFNAHYAALGYHPLVCYDALTRDPIRVELRKGSEYCGKDAADFMRPIFEEYRRKYPGVMLYFRGDSGFATPELYDLCEEFGVRYVIRLKQNPRLSGLGKYLENILLERAHGDYSRHDTAYGQFCYQAASWSCARRVVCKMDRPSGQFSCEPMYIVTNIPEENLPIKRVIALYCNRGAMENFIKESKNGFFFGTVSSSSMIVNSNRLLIHMLAHCIFNWFRRLTLPAEMANMTVDTIRLHLLKIASRVVRSGRYLHFRLCSSCPARQAFMLTFARIQSLPL
mgnify:CR=1 FL=1